MQSQRDGWQGGDHDFIERYRPFFDSFASLRYVEERGDFSGRLEEDFWLRRVECVCILFSRAIEALRHRSFAKGVDILSLRSLDNTR